MFKNVNILEYDDDIQNHHDKCIEISTNMPGNDLKTREIGLRFMQKQKLFTIIDHEKRTN